ncbi:MAG: TetR/AcrR family transcriptional regulator [Pseudomonadota bacterium]
MARRTQAQLAETREALILAAKQLFAEKGYGNTQIAEIAATAGTGISAFYGQFTDKEALFLLIVNEMFGDLHAGVLALRKDMSLASPLTAVTTLARIHDLVFAKLWKHKEIALSAFRSGFSAIPALEKQYWEICDAMVDAMAQDIGSSQASGLVTLTRPRDMADAILGMIQQLAHRMAREGSPTPEEASQLCTRMVIGGLLTTLPPALAAEFIHQLPTLLSTQREIAS